MRARRNAYLFAFAETFGFTPAQVDALHPDDFEALVRGVEQRIAEAKKEAGRA